jgi:hypothetical protein
MTTIIDGSAGITFPNSTVQASAGSVIQTFQATSTLFTSTTSTTVVTTNLLGTITPKFSTSKILVRGAFTIQTNQTQVVFSLYRGTVAGTLLGQWTVFSTNGATSQFTVPFEYLDSPATTSATTYTVGFLTASAGTIYVSPGGQLGVITLMEIAA